MRNALDIAGNDEVFPQGSRYFLHLLGNDFAFYETLDILLADLEKLNHVIRTMFCAARETSRCFNNDVVILQIVRLTVVCDFEKRIKE